MVYGACNHVRLVTSINRARSQISRPWWRISGSPSHSAVDNVERVVDHYSCAPFPLPSTQPSSSWCRSRIAPPSSMAPLLPHRPSSTVPRCIIVTSCQPVSRNTPHFSVALVTTAVGMLVSGCPLFCLHFLLFPCGREIAACAPCLGLPARCDAPCAMGVCVRANPCSLAARLTKLCPGTIVVCASSFHAAFS